MATLTEAFVSANTDPKKKGKDFRIRRPYDEKKKVVEISMEKQAQIDAMLTPIF